MMGQWIQNPNPSGVCNDRPNPIVPSIFGWHKTPFFSISSMCLGNASSLTDKQKSYSLLFIIIMHFIFQIYVLVPVPGYQSLV